MRVGRIALNPEGRVQTKKRRAVVPICPTLAAELESWPRDSCFFVSLKPAPCYQSVLQASGGVTGSAHIIRDTVRTWLAEHGVPDSDADMFMGHKGSGSHTRARYTHRRPEYPISVTEALEELFPALTLHYGVPQQAKCGPSGQLGTQQSSAKSLRRLERANGFEPSTCTLARYRSTN